MRITFLVDGWIWKDVVEGPKHYFAVVLFNRIGCDEGPTANRIWHTQHAMFTKEETRRLSRIFGNRFVVGLEKV